MVPCDSHEDIFWATTYSTLGEVVLGDAETQDIIEKYIERARHQAPIDKAKRKGIFIHFLGGDGWNTMLASPKAFLNLSCLHVIELTISTSMACKVRAARLLHLLQVSAPT